MHSVPDCTSQIQKRPHIFKEHHKDKYFYLNKQLFINFDVVIPKFTGVDDLPNN